MEENMLKKYAVENIITNAFKNLDGLISKPDEDGNFTVYEAQVEKDDMGNLILIFKEDCLSDNMPDKYRIKVEYIE